MRINWNNKYTTISVYAFIVIIASCLFRNALSEMDTVLQCLNWITLAFQPFVIGFVIAYLLNFILKFYEKKVFTIKTLDKIKKPTVRKLSVLLSYLTAILFLYSFIQFVLPQLIESVSGLVTDIPYYVKQLSTTIEDKLYHLDINQEHLTLIGEKLTDFINWFIELLTGTLPYLGNALINFASSLWNIVLGAIISVYLLLDKENFIASIKKFIISLFSEKTSKRIIELTSRTGFMFSRFISGQILDAFIVAVLMFIILTILNMPYALFIAVLMGSTNIIPFFGPFIGAIPSAIIVLFVAPSQFLLFIIVVLAVQQIDANLIGPRILGDSIGIHPFWILFSVLVFGELLGFIGMVVGVPLFGVFHSVVKETTEKRLELKNLPTETSYYINTKEA